MASHKRWHLLLTCHNSKIESNDTRFLIAATKRSFEIIAPLSISTSDYGAVQDTLNRIHEECAKYLVCMRNNVETAQLCYSFARKVQELRGILHDRNTSSDEFIRTFIREMWRIAQKASATAKAVADMIRVNRQKFAKIRAKTSLQIARTFIFLPHIAVPELGAQIFEEQDKSRETKVVSCKKALERLELAEKDLEQLILQLETLSRYWLDVETTLRDIETRVEEVRDDYMLQMTIWGLDGDWKDIEDDYNTYKIALMSLLDCWTTIHNTHNL